MKKSKIKKVSIIQVRRRFILFLKEYSRIELELWYLGNEVKE